MFQPPDRHAQESSGTNSGTGTDSAANSGTVWATRALDATADPLEIYERLRDGGCSWLLDSALLSERLGRYSFVGSDPHLVLRARGRRLELECRRRSWPGLAPGHYALWGDPITAVRDLMPPMPRSGGPPLPFAGGAVGWFGYELAEVFDVHELPGRDDWQLPDALWLFTDRLVAFDHETAEAWAMALATNAASATTALEELLAKLDREPSRPTRGGAQRDEVERARDEGVQRGTAPRRMSVRSAVPDTSPSGYTKSVETILDEISAGNVYQACLTERVETDFRGDPWSLYRSLRRHNPAPFACFLELPEVSVLGSSPERFLRVDPDRRVESRPIKGTRPRGRHPEEDERNRLDLQHSAKDRAENLMIVDLVRNDLGRVCEPASIEVPELMHVEAYAGVFQLVSTVRGRLAQDRDALDLVRATFPPGSMTGAPKIAAMRLLARLEPVRRGIYSGALGYLDARGGADLSVVIRSMFVREGRVHLHAGGGIVADSDPKAEYAEFRDKLRPLLAALAEPEEA